MYMYREYESTFSRLLHDEVVNRGAGAHGGGSGGDDLVRSASAVDLVRATTLVLNPGFELDLIFQRARARVRDRDTVTTLRW